MTIADKFLEKERFEKEQQEQERRDYARNLGERINKALLDPAFIQKVTPILVERGAVQFSDVGCLCQGGFCSNQKGFTEYCQEAREFWKNEGVTIQFSIKSGLVVAGHQADLFFGYNPKVTLYSNE